MTIIKKPLTKEDYQQTPDDYDIADSVKGTWKFILAGIVGVIFLLGLAFFMGWIVYNVCK